MTSKKNRDRNPHVSGGHHCQAVQAACKKLEQEADIPQHVTKYSKLKFREWFNGAVAALGISGETRREVLAIIG